MYHVYQKYFGAWSLFCSWPGTGSPPPTLQKSLLAMDLLTMRFNCPPCPFQYSFHWGIFPGEPLPHPQTIDGYWIFTTRQITVICLECDPAIDFKCALSSTRNHGGNSSELMAHLVLSSDDCSRYCSLPLSLPRYDYQIWSCRNDLQPGPCNLCRLSARMANSTYSWKNNQEDSQSAWI